jgi:hypothetical protein
MRNFEREVETIGDKIKPLTKHFSTASELNMKSSLQPALKTGAKKGTAAAIPICESSWPKSRRTNNILDPSHDGLYWATHQATARRQGVITSGSAGIID